MDLGCSVCCKSNMATCGMRVVLILGLIMPGTILNPCSEWGCFITRNEREVDYPITYTDTNLNAILFIDTPDNTWNNNTYSSIATPCFTLISGNGFCF